MFEIVISLALCAIAAFFALAPSRRMLRRCFATAALSTQLASIAHGVIITVDYSLDTSGFFSANNAARNAVNAAAADLSAAILPSLGAISSDFFSGSSGGATATLDWAMTYTHPVTNATISVPTFSLAIDQITIYAGMQMLMGSTLGEGGPGGAGLNVGLSGPSGQHQAAMNAAMANSNATMPREAGGLAGPIMGTLSGNIGSASYNVSYGALTGSLWFDNDTDNNGVLDSASTLDAFWHFNHTTSVAAGKNDFYSVALHEILHSIGFGNADTWDTLRSGTTWMGSNAQSLNGGSGANLVSGDGGHIASGYMSTRLSDGGSQEVAMDPSLTTGTRKTLTFMDLAFLRDIGYATVPEPGAALLLVFGVLRLFVRRTRPGARPIVSF